MDLTPSVWEEGEEAAAEDGDGEKVQEALGGGGDDVETSDSTKEAAGSEGGEQQLGKIKVPALPSRRKPKGVVMRGWETPVSRPGCTRMATMKLTAGADVAEQQLGNEEALLILPHGYDPDEEDEPAYCFLAPAPEEPASMEEALAGPDREKLVLFLVYVDDILLFSSSMKEIQKVQQQLMKNFKCKTLGEVKYYLGMHVERDLDHRWLKLAAVLEVLQAGWDGSKLREQDPKAKNTKGKWYEGMK
ncbi:unnamed protein product [Closterium sp. NIES-53]